MKNRKFLQKAFFLFTAGITLFAVQACEEKDEPVLVPSIDREDMIESIDLGLPSGTLWASCNVGASSPEEYGDYFAWGETTVKGDYSWQTYQWCNGTYESMSTDCVDSIELSQQYDVALAKWGDQWRMPTVADFKELATECTWTWTTQNGVKGYEVKGTNGNCIFLPAAGCRRDGTTLHGGYTGCYWSTTLYGDDTQHAHLLYFNDDSYSYKFRNFRVDGRSVRPVTGGGYKFDPNFYSGEINGYKYVDLGLSVKWATYNVGANTPEDYGDYFAWGEVETKEIYNWTTYKWGSGIANSVTKYVNNPQYATYDNKTTLDFSDDVAHVKWGNRWRMPTQSEVEELINSKICTWKQITYKGVNCQLVTGPNGNSIVLPAAGYRYNLTIDTPSGCGSHGYYWSASLDSVENDRAVGFTFGPPVLGYAQWEIWESRSDGFTVRPVTE